jgi:Ser/Thr protein kinase RdoA (MazF antagonist)
MYSLERISWIQKWNQEMDWSQISITKLPAGMEAEVLKLSTGDENYVLKIWNKQSKPDVEYQYNVLLALKANGVAVSSALGWGIDQNHDKVLLTSYDGNPLNEESDIHAVSKLLVGLHKVSASSFDPNLLRSYDFITYFFPRIDDHPDIKESLLGLVRCAPESLIGRTPS